jgi:hypothetical protein
MNQNQKPFDYYDDDIFPLYSSFYFVFLSFHRRFGRRIEKFKNSFSLSHSSAREIHFVWIVDINWRALSNLSHSRNWKMRAHLLSPPPPPLDEPKCHKKKKIPLSLIISINFQSFFLLLLLFSCVSRRRLWKRKISLPSKSLGGKKPKRRDKKKKWFFFSCLRVRVCVSSVCEETYTNNMCDFFKKIWKPLKMLLCAAPPSR